jgi:hypothetical protein
MAIVKVQIGATSGSLVTLDKGLVNEELDYSRQEQTKNKITWHGHRNVTILGQTKRVYKCVFTNITSALYQTVSDYALSSRKWWVKIPGYTGYDIFDGFAYVKFDGETVQRITDTDALYGFTLLVSEL